MEKQDIDPKDHGISAKFIMLYSGSIGSWYMFDEIAAFFNEIDKTFDNTLFLILTNNDPQEVDGLLKDKNISKDKYKIMSLTRSEVADWLKIADVSVFFIKPCFSKQFSCPTKLAESLACGVPVVINSGIGDTDSFVKDNKVGVVIDSFAPEVLKDGVSRLIKLLKDGIVLEKRCRKLAEDEFSLEKGVDTYRRIYNQV
jgi:glycosyltransferase involved in cell wall biosynthesis